MKLFEGMHCGWRCTNKLVIEQMTRPQLVEWLEFRGMACYDDESTESLRETAIEDYDDES